VDSHSRGLTVKNDLIVVSGFKGNIDKISLEKHNKTHFVIDTIEDFRDVHINTDGSLLLVNSGKFGRIVKLFPNGESEVVFNQDNIFLDGISFYKDSEIGFAYGDPIDSTFVVLKTIDSGKNWTRINPNVLPVTLRKEASFAASGTGMQTPEENVIYIGTGVSEVSRIFRSFDNGLTWDFVTTPMKSGGSFGIYSMHFNSAKEGYIIGGSYIKDKFKKNICFYTKNKGKSWTDLSLGLPGYMSCIHGNEDLSLLVATGRNGTYYSLDKGKHWRFKSLTPYYSCVVTDSKVIFSGKDGTFEIINYKLD
jgi:photosystem II stability/assembly factor-like uncharacterized protein